MKPDYSRDGIELYHGDCLEVLGHLPAESIHAVVTDPPYGLGFMGKGWDHGVPGGHFWREVIRVCKPGAHLLAFGGTRTFHRLAVAIEDAGWEIRDTIMWVYGSGFPKSLDVSKAIDKAAGAEREKVPATGSLHNNARLNDDGWSKIGADSPMMDSTAPATEAAQQWNGWGTALKPAWEPIIVARKPIDGTVANNVLTHGCGGINVDGCRVVTEDVTGWNGYFSNGFGGYAGGSPRPIVGRWPANLVHDGSEEVVGLFPETKSGDLTGQPRTENKIYGSAANTLGQQRFHTGDSGSAARFFYCAKASKSDRGEDNRHPTVKPTALMRWLCRLVTPPDGIVLDPFMGSGSTGKAALRENFRFVGIELEEESLDTAVARIEAEFDRHPLFDTIEPENQSELFTE
jgi:site-specific DNA-methyltransferase (adenine-specific)